jgi:hypothetical protein
MRLLGTPVIGLGRFATMHSCRTSNVRRRHVLSFLVTLFFTRVKKRVTRSSKGGVEALALTIKKRKNWIPAYAGMTSGGLPAPQQEEWKLWL